MLNTSGKDDKQTYRNSMKPLALVETEIRRIVKGKISIFFFKKKNP